MNDVAQVLVTEIPAAIVREVAQSRPEAGDFRDLFPRQQADVAEHIETRLEHLDPAAAELAVRLAAALWAIYRRALAGVEIPVLDSRQVGALEPVARELLDDLARRQAPVEGAAFDPEWLVGLRRGPQPHVVGFLVGALRASRLRFPGEVIFEVAVVLLAVAGTLEAAAARARQTA
jgi:hypothetical protein